ncbi:hypothetical protein [Loktanella sp. S4079]|uniref:hypothetical protein n=1 Tax=Loktanella sp. S4079 TaxID=579483 RepID=UPI000AF1C6DB|nr:hypothetical protein [Loktanella sp. S4079]
MLDGDERFGRRKVVQRTVTERAAIVSETYEVGATVAEVAARRVAVPEQPLGFAAVAVMPEPVHPAHDGFELVQGALVVHLP